MISNVSYWVPSLRPANAIAVNDVMAPIIQNAALSVWFTGGRMGWSVTQPRFGRLGYSHSIVPGGLEVMS